MNKIYKLLQYLILLTLIILFFDFFDISLMDSCLCDSGSTSASQDNVDDHVYDIDESNDNNNDTRTRDLAKLHILDRIRRRFSWYCSGKNSSRFSSYDEFKSTWNPKTKVWNEVKSFIKEDIRKSRAEAFKMRQESEENAKWRMFQKTEARRLENLQRLERHNKLYSEYPRQDNSIFSRGISIGSKSKK